MLSKKNLQIRPENFDARNIVKWLGSLPTPKQKWLPIIIFKDAMYKGRLTWISRHFPPIKE